MSEQIQIKKPKCIWCESDRVEPARNCNGDQVWHCKDCGEDMPYQVDDGW